MVVDSPWRRCLKSSRPKDFIASLGVAVHGLVFTFKTQRHMRFHLYVVLTVILLGLLVNLPLREMLVLLFTISLVLVAEMFNSAIEATVDLISPNYSPMAKFAKDISAGAVLITTIMALIVGGLLILGENRWEAIKINMTTESVGLPMASKFLFGWVVLFILIIIGKGLGKRGRVLQGGRISGHAAYAFFFATSTIFITNNAVATAIALLLAAIVAQSRYEAKFHSAFELAVGTLVGVIVALVLFGLIPK